MLAMVEAVPMVMQWPLSAHATFGLEKFLELHLAGTNFFGHLPDAKCRSRDRGPEIFR